MKMEMMKILRSAVVILLGLRLTASAQTTMQQDSNALLPASTNTYPLSGDITGSFTNGTALGGNTWINAQYSTVFFLQCGGVFTNSTANSSNVTFRIAASNDTQNWTNNFDSITLAVPGNTTNFAFATRYYTNSPLYFSLRSCENSNTANIGGRSATIYLKGVGKNGI